MYRRDIEQIVIESKKFPVIAILGPRQSGKTTLAKAIFKQHVYTSLEDPNTRYEAQKDPEGFFKKYENEHGIIVDEFQYVPELLSYIQLQVDEYKRPGYFVLTGSQNYLMNQAITQSLAGRVSILTLLPLSMHELKGNGILKASLEEVIFYGNYPRIYSEHAEPHKLYADYLQTYVERDVRQLINVGDLGLFQLFIKLCAGRVGQLVNYEDLADSCGISTLTVKRWLSILESSYTVFLLPPHFKNFNKRLTKSPKIYFYDTGLLSYLLAIESPRQIALSSMRGHIFECFVIADIYKQYFNIGRRPPVYFWRDLNGRIEIDCVISQAEHLFPVEIKSSMTKSMSMYEGLAEWGELSKTPEADRYVVYAGETERYGHQNLIGWQDIDMLVERIRSKIPR